MKQKFIAILILLFLLVFGISIQIKLQTRPVLSLQSSEQQQPAVIEQADAAPDLVIQSLTVQPPNPAAGSKITVTVVVKNQGDQAVAAGKTIDLHIYIEPSDDPPTITTTATNRTSYGLGLAAGDTFEYTISDRDVTQANAKVYVWVDRDNKIAEGDESNNLFPKPAPPGVPDAFDLSATQDDTCATATDIQSNGTPQEHNLVQQNGQPDVDWLKFTGKSGVKYVVQAIAIGRDAQLNLALHSVCESGASLGGLIITFTATTNGPYYLELQHDLTTYGPETNYQVKVTSNDTPCSTSYEPNNICQVPSEVAVNTSAQTQAFCEAKDVDWLRMAVRAGAQYTISVNNVGNKADTQLALYTNCDQASSAAGSSFKFKASSRGFVYIKAENANSDVFGLGTEYTIKIEGTQGCDEDGLEPDNRPDQAQPLRLDGPAQAHTPCPAGDTDWVKFDATEGMTYTVETLNLGQRSDTRLCQHDANGKELRCDDDSGAGKGSRLTLVNTTAGTNLFSIKDLDAEVAGDNASYDVRLITGLCKNDALEPDNIQASAKTIPSDGTLQEHTICAADDADWSSFSASANTSYVIATSKTGPEADTIIELYDKNGVFLARNDDHSPGVSSQLVYNIQVADTYFVRTQLYNPSSYGAGTEYALSVRSGSPPPTPTPPNTPPPGATATATPPPSEIQTIILVNRTRMVQLHGEEKTAQLMAKLQELANHNQVSGDIIRLDNNSEVSAAYAPWLAEQTSVDKANLATDAIRRVITTYLQARSGIKFVVLVGDDRALPFRRVLDGVDKSSEKDYKSEVDSSSPTGAAIHGNYYMTDDYYVDLQPTQIKGHEVYIPDLSIGRLIEKPDDMIGMINNFIESPITLVEQVLVTGYDFINDTAQENCKDWRKGVGSSKVNCLVIEVGGISWTKEQMKDLQLRGNNPFKVQSINGHAYHSGEGIASSGNLVISGEEIVAATMHLGGGLIYTLGCHSGLNVPPTNNKSPLDLAEAFTIKGANYVGNTGFGYGLLYTIGLSEKLMRLYTTQLLRGKDNTSIGRALATAKRQYFDQDDNFSPYDEKVMQQLIFYGLPMHKLDVPGALAGPGEDFPGVDFDVIGSLPPPDPSLGGLITRSVQVNFQQAINTGVLSEAQTTGGDYFTLNGYTSADADEPVQALHFGTVATQDSAQARSVIMRGAKYVSSTLEDPLIGTPVNEYLPRDSGSEVTLDLVPGLRPDVISSLNTHDNQSTLVTTLSQYDPSTGNQLVYSGFEADIVYSTSTDQTPPQLLAVDGLFNLITKRVSVKVGATDASGIREVTLAYIEDIRQASTSIKSIKLTFDATTQKWVGSFNGDVNTRFYPQVLDKEGNLLTDTNKGQYYRPSEERAISVNSFIYLPVARR